MEESADDNSKSDENGEEFSKRVEKHCGNGRNRLLRAISPFPTVFSKVWYSRHVKTRAWFGKGLCHIIESAQLILYQTIPSFQNLEEKAFRKIAEVHLSIIHSPVLEI